MSAGAAVKGAATSVASSKAVMGGAGNYGPAILAATGGITFANQWLQKGDNGVDWGILPWTAVGMIALSLIGAVEPFLANSLAATALITELLVPFHGRKAPIQALLGVLPKEN
jgi:hypothetical protein